MRTTSLSRLWALLCLFLCSNIVLAGVARPNAPRDGADNPISTTTTANSDGSTSTYSTDSTAKSTTSSLEAASLVSSPFSSTGSSTWETATATATATATSTGSTYNNTLYNVTITAGQLPLKPQITPGFSVAGLILMLTGTAYALVGIKTRVLHCFFGVGFLAALGVTVLILFVMNPPVSNATQGGYVVAVAGTGLLLGGLMLVFRDVIECVSCLLGGFCLSMWLLTLKANGLVGQGGTGVIIFISLFTAAGLSGFFVRRTRTYFMIACISLSGATAVVIGIDCFTRAGLKEFWAWIWDLNDNLFPLGADNYPLTRGIRVEQAATILIAFVGAVSQTKLWNLIRGRRERREAKRTEAEAALRKEEENIGRDVERSNAHERDEWEAVWGNPKGPKSPTSEHTANDSVVGDTESEKKYRNSGTTTTVVTRRTSTVAEGEGIEMAEMHINEDREGEEGRLMGDGSQVGGENEYKPEVPPKPKTAAEKVLEKNEKNGAVTILVAVDEVETAAIADAKANAQANAQAKAETTVKMIQQDDKALFAKSSVRGENSGVPAPEVVPLPFRIPTNETEANKDDEDRSTVATFDELDNELRDKRSDASRRSSFAQRLSAGSVELFQRISQRSLSKQLEAAAQGKGDSRKDLTSPVQADDESVMAIFDDDSDGEDDIAMTPRDERHFSMEVKAELADNLADANVGGRTENPTAVDANTSGHHAPEVNGMIQAAEAISAKMEGNQKEVVPSVEDETGSKAGKSIASKTESVSVNLTKDRLPRGLSKIAMSYRTNEWAKHLTNAEAPSPEELHIPEDLELQVAAATAVEERAAPVDVGELQKTAENAAPRPAMPRSESRMSMARSQTSSVNQPSNLKVPGSQISFKTPPHSPTNLGGASPSPSRHSPRPRVSSHTRRGSSRTVDAIAEEDDNQSSMSSDGRLAAQLEAAAALVGAQSIKTSRTPSETHVMTPTARPLSSRPQVPGVVSYDSPQSMIAKRDVLLRAKNQALRQDYSQEVLIPMPSDPGLDASSMPNVPAYGAVAALGPPDAPGSNTNSGRTSRISRRNSGSPVDVDNLPLSQRREMLRHDSTMSANSSKTSQAFMGAAGSSISLAAPAIMNSYQLQRGSNTPSQMMRNSQLASFRQSAQADLNPHTSTFPVVNANAQLGYGGRYNMATPTPPTLSRTSTGGPLINSVYGIPGTSWTNSIQNIPYQQVSYDSEIQRDIDVQRQVMMSQREMEQRRRDTLKAERERNSLMFEERIRSDSGLLDRHREAMRRLQRAASRADQNE